MKCFVYYCISFPTLRDAIMPLVKENERIQIPKGTNVFLTDNLEIADSVYHLFYKNGGPCKNIIKMNEFETYGDIHTRINNKYKKRDSFGNIKKVVSKWTLRYR